LKDKHINYNSAFDINILNYCCRLHNLPILKLKKRSDCLMNRAAQWSGELEQLLRDYNIFPSMETPSVGRIAWRF
jgi:hypothetical protein